MIVPVRNGAAHIAEAVTSALAQLDPTDELLVIDDGSTDDTLSVVTAITDSRVRVMSAPRRGPAAARNAGLAVARGAFIAFLDHDDYWPAGRHQAMLQMLVDDPSLGAIYGRIRVQFDDGIAPTKQYLDLDGTVPQHASVCCSFYRRSFIDQVGGFAEDMSFAEDIDFNLRLAEIGVSTGIWSGVCLVHRRHKTNVTNNRQRFREGMLLAFRRKVERARLRRLETASASPQISQ